MKDLEFMGTCSNPEIANLADQIVDHGRPRNYKRTCARIIQYDDTFSGLFDVRFRNPWADETKVWNGFLNVTHSAVNYVFRLL